MLQWFIFFIPSIILLTILAVTKLVNIFRNQSPYDLTASIGRAETVISADGGVIKVENRKLFVETYGAKIKKGSKVLIVKYVPEKEIYMVELYI